MGRLIRAVGYKGTDVRELLDHMVVFIVRRYTVMDVAGG